MGSADQTQVVSLGGQQSYFLSHLTRPKYGHFLKFWDKVRIVLSVSISGSLANTVFITE